NDARRRAREGVRDERYRIAGLQVTGTARSVLKGVAMFRRVLLLAFALCLITVPARAQFVVIDPANLVQTTLMAFRLQQHYAELRAQYLTVLRMSQGLGNLNRYR